MILAAVVIVSCPGFALAYVVCSSPEDGQPLSRLAAWAVMLLSAMGIVWMLS